MFQLRFLEKFPPDNTFFGRIYRNWVGWRPGQRWIRPYRSKSAVGTRLSRKIARCESPKTLPEVEPHREQVMPEVRTRCPALPPPIKASVYKLQAYY